MRYEPQPPQAHQDRSKAPALAAELLEAYKLADFKRRIERGLDQIRDELAFLKSEQQLPNGETPDVICQQYEKALTELASSYEQQTNTTSDCETIYQNIEEFLHSTHELRVSYQANPIRTWFMLIAVICCFAYILIIIMS